MLELARQHHLAGRLAEAEAIYRQILAANPHHAEALHLLSLIARQTNHPAAGLQLLQRALALVPNEPRFRSSCGFLLFDLGRWDDAAAEFRHAVRLRPDYADAHFGLGLALTKRQAFTEALKAYQAAVRFDPNHADAYLNAGILLYEGGQLEQAVQAFQTVLALQPRDPKAINNLGNTLRGLGRVEAAVRLLGQGVAMHPQAAVMHSNLLYSLLFQPGCPRAAFFAESERWRQRHADPLAPRRRPHGNDRRAERRLRIGYISPNFRRHVIGRNMLPLLRSHDRTQFEVICYSDVSYPDDLTESFRNLVDLWRESAALSDEQLAEQVRQDGVDILVDLTMHLVGSRLLAFARKPAPVQVTMAAYPETTGLDCFNGRFTDEFLDPSELGDRFSSEKRIRLRSFWCFDPLGDKLEVGDPPSLQDEFVTFGCFTDFSKVNDGVLDLWAQVLGKISGSRLLLLCPAGSAREQTLARLQAAGILAERIEFTARLSRSDYLRAHQRVDVILDPFPYNGHTTSCDALWMGVPVVTLAGETAVGRGGLSILSNAGLRELVAFTPEEYVRIAVDLASNRTRLAELRAGLRAQMQRSVLMDAPGFTREVESACRELWRTWCATPDL